LVYKRKNRLELNKRKKNKSIKIKKRHPWGSDSEPVLARLLPLSSSSSDSGTKMLSFTGAVDCSAGTILQPSSDSKILCSPYIFVKEKSVGICID
jgi:hypothetical protein